MSNTVMQNEDEQVQSGVTTFIPANYYICLNTLFYIEADGNKRLVTDTNEISNNQQSAIVANCNSLNMVPYWAPPAQGLSNETIIWIVVGVILGITVILIVLGFIFLY